MSLSLRAIAQVLQQLTLTIAQSAEITAAEVAEVDTQIVALDRAGLLAEQVFLGEIVSRQSYGAGGDPSSAHLVQAALLVTRGGLGAIYWNLETFDGLHRSGKLEQACGAYFQPFSACTPLEKALLMPALAKLVARLVGQLELAADVRPTAPSIR